MAFVSRAKIARSEIDHPDWARIAAAIHALPNEPEESVSLFGGAEAWMLVSYAPGYGFYSGLCEEQDQGEMLLVDPSRGVGLIQATIAGNRDEVPYCALVEEAMVEQAAHVFFETGRRDPTLAWRNPFELEAEAS